MVNLIVATHGEFSRELVNSAKMVYGEIDNLHVVTFLPGEGPDNLVEKYEAIIATLPSNQSVLFLVDLFGGSPYNAASRILAKRPQDDIVTGVNLPMLLEAMDASSDEESASDLAAIAKEVGELSIKTCHQKGEIPKAKADSDEEEVPAEDDKTQYDPNGRMNISLMRIDSRLIHGQVMTSWAKTVKCDAIFAISDDVANDDIRRELLLQIVPPHLKGYVITVDKAIKVWHNPKYASRNIIWLVTNPTDIVRLIEGGVKIQNVNVGGMTYREGDQLISQAVAINQKDLASFYKLLELGVNMSLQQVAANKKEALDKARLDAIKF